MNYDSVGFGIVGLGMAAGLHRDGILANAEAGARLRAVAARDPLAVSGKAREFHAPCVGFQELLADPGVDVVCLCTPSGQHAAQALEVARAGKHLLVEKPMALSLEDADAVIREFSERGLLLGVALQRRADPMFQRISRAVEAGDLGRLVQGVVTIPYHRSMEYYDSAAWRGTWALDGGGVLMNQGCHLADLLVWFMGDPVRVRASAKTLVHGVEVEDTLAATLEFSGGALATLAATTANKPGFPHRVEILGTEGGIQMEGENVIRWDLADPGKARVEPWPCAAQQGAGAGGDPAGVGAAGHARLMENFMAALRGDETLVADGIQARRSLALILEIYEQAGLM